MTQSGEPDFPFERVLQVEDLHVSFNVDKDYRLDAVKGVSLHIDKGETLALVGESGSGKSVTAMTVMRLTEHEGATIMGGSVRMRLRDGRIPDLTKLSIPDMTRIRGADISMVFQDPMASLNPVFTIGDQIAEAVIQHQNKSRAEAMEVALKTLKLVRVPDAERRLKQFPHQLSGGMRQRVVIAIALSCRPSLMILDEPTTALDVTIQAQIIDLVRALQDEIGMSVLYITHDMGVVAEVADRVCVMLNGRIIETGPVYDIFAAPKHRYTQSLMAAVPRLGSMEHSDTPEKFPLVSYIPDALDAAPMDKS